MKPQLLDPGSRGSSGSWELRSSRQRSLKVFFVRLRTTSGIILEATSRVVLLYFPKPFHFALKKRF